jgi:F0F1-type ATP synthase membrane subunit b/b'
VEKSVTDVRDTFDDSLVKLQAKAEKVMEPIKPTLAKAQTFEPQLKAVDPDIELPDQDLDEEFNEMRELVNPKFDEAQKLLNLDESIPWFLRTPRDFFWYVVFPVLLIAFIVQLVFAWLTTYLATSSSSSSALRMLHEVIDSVKDQSQPLREEAHEQVQSFQNEAQEKAQQLQDQAQEQYHAFQEEAQSGMEEFKTQFEATVESSKVMLINVAVSYAMALLQIFFVYLISSPRVRAWIINMVIRIMSNKALRVLRDSGVETAYKDVFLTNMTKTRDTLLKIINVAAKISKVVGLPSGLNIFGGGGDPGKSGTDSSPAGVLENVLSPSSDSTGTKPGGMLGLGRMFSSKSPKK